MFLQEKKLNLLYFSISSPRPLRFTAVPSWALLHIKMVMITKKTATFVIFKEMLQCNGDEKTRQHCLQEISWSKIFFGSCPHILWPSSYSQDKNNDTQTEYIQVEKYRLSGKLGLGACDMTMQGYLLQIILIIITIRMYCYTSSFVKMQGM